MVLYAGTGEQRKNEIEAHFAQLDEPCYGFGAAQMLPVLAHHMGSDLSFLEAILDEIMNQDILELPLAKVDCT